MQKIKSYSLTNPYGGYYYNANSKKYYKVSNLNVYQDSEVATHTGDNLTTSWTFTDYMGDGINNDGTLMVASGSFRKEITDYVDPMDLTYLKLSEGEVEKNANESEYSGMDAGQYLVASYDRGNNTAMAVATAAADAYDKAIHEFEYADALFNKAQSEYETAHDTELDAADKALNGDPANPTTTPGATKTLTDAQANYQNALAEYNNALTAYNNALDKLKETKKVYEDSMKKLYGGVKGGETGKVTTDTYSPQDDEAAANTSSGYTAGSLYGKYRKALDERKKAGIEDDYKYNDTANGSTEKKGIEEEYSTYKSSEGAPEGLPAEYTGLDTAQLKTFRDWVDDNTTAEEHEHWMLVIDELIAKTNYDNEKAKCLGNSGKDYTDAASGYGKAYKDALGAYKEAYTTLGDTSKNTDFTTYADGTVIKNGTGEGEETDKLEANSGKKKALDDAKTTLTGAEGDYKDALSDYQEALEKSNAAEELRDAAAALRAAAEDAQTKAETAYNAVNTADKLGKSDGAVKIYIKLNDDAVITSQTAATNETWYLDPVTLGGSNDVTTGTLLNNKAVFYYNGLLEGGETSSKLVDYVLLDPHATQNDYKNFDFDINVALKSAQINLDESGNIKTDAAQAELAKFAKYNNGGATSDVNQVVEWSDAATVPAGATGTTYKVGGTAVTVETNDITALSTAYPKKVVIATDITDSDSNVIAEAGTYVGASEAGTYYKVNGTALASPEVTINVSAS